MDGHCDICKDQLSNGFISFKIFEEETFAKQHSSSSQRWGCWFVVDVLAQYGLMSDQEWCTLKNVRVHRQICIFLTLWVHPSHNSIQTRNFIYVSLIGGEKLWIACVFDDKVKYELFIWLRFMTVFKLCNHDIWVCYTPTLIDDGHGDSNYNVQYINVTVISWP